MIDLLPGQPEADGEPVFREPWEAHAFAMAVRLHEQGLFTWPQWAATLAEVGGTYGEAIGSGGVLVTGSVVTVGQARAMIRPRGDS